MDVLTTGMFEISASTNDFLTEYQQLLAQRDLLRRAQVALERIQRSGVPYVTCFYPVERQGDKLVLKGFCAVALWEDCEVNEAVFLDWDNLDLEWLKERYDKEFVLIEVIRIREDQIYIYRRIK